MSVLERICSSLEVMQQRFGMGLTRPLGLRQKMAAKAALGRVLCSSTSLEKPSGALKRYCVAESGMMR